MNALLSRRRMLAISAAAAAGATLFDIPAVLRAAGLNDQDDPYAGFPMGIQTFSLRKFDLNEATRHIQGLGLHHAELFKGHLDTAADDRQIALVRDTLAKGGITMSAHGVNNFSKDHEANRKLFDFAKRAGLKNITANPSYDAFDSLDKLFAEYDIRIAIHNHGPGALYDTIESVQKVVDGRHKNVGVCVDTGHFIRSREDPVKAIRELKGRVFGVHVKDCAEQQARTENVVIGAGFLDVAGMFKALRAVKFPADGALSIEYEANPDNPVDDIQQCLDVAKKTLAELAG